MITVSLGADDFDHNGFVFVWRMANAILDAMGGKVACTEKTSDWFREDATSGTSTRERYPVMKERAIWARIDAAIVAGHLRPIDSSTTAFRERYEIADAVVPFDDVVLWGKASGHYSFERVCNGIDAEKVGADSTAVLDADSMAVKISHDGTAHDEEPKTKNWILLVQAEATRRWKSLREAGANPTKHNIKDDLATWCRETNVQTDGDINPSGDYIYRHVLRKWTPPKG